MNIKTQTIVSQTDLDAAGKAWGFGAAQAFIEFGVEDGKGNRVFDSAIWNRITNSYKGKGPKGGKGVFSPKGHMPADEFAPPQKGKGKSNIGTEETQSTRSTNGTRSQQHQEDSWTASDWQDSEWDPASWEDSSSDVWWSEQWWPSSWWSEGAGWDSAFLSTQNS